MLFFCINYATIEREGGREFVENLSICSFELQMEIYSLQNAFNESKRFIS